MKTRVIGLCSGDLHATALGEGGIMPVIADEGGDIYFFDKSEDAFQVLEGLPNPGDGAKFDTMEPPYPEEVFRHYIWIGYYCTDRGNYVLISPGFSYAEVTQRGELISAGSFEDGIYEDYDQELREELENFQC